jgi:UDP-N-acetylglucosamine--N-acetylmuramyl-(pentapeptide) pyrophosphoryl-undecaprenol N-acetylglucosamine transferase
MPTVIFAGAGTAGHVEPALAVAAWLRENHPEVESKFLGTVEGVEGVLVPAAQFPLLVIDKVPFPRRMSPQLFTWPWRFNKALKQTKLAMAGTDLVIGFGGYVAACAYVEAKRLHLPIIAHEANAKMGMANKLAKRYRATMLLTFSGTGGRVVGIPLRESIVALSRINAEERQAAKHKARRSMHLDPDAPTILVFGGSLGSMKFNETIASTRKELAESGLQIIHAVGNKNELPKAQAGYLPLAYIDDMASAYAASDLVISRSGASTVVETGVLGIYSLYVPLPIGNGEQAHNAQVVVRCGGGEIITNQEFTGDWLRSNISRLMQSAVAFSGKSNHLELPLDASAEIGAQILKELRHG